MENKMIGVFFNPSDVKAIVEAHIDWAEVAEDQIFCVHHVMHDNTPIGTSITVDVDGIKCEDGSDEIKLILSAGTYELTVKTVTDNDEINLHLDGVIPMHGTYGQLVDGELDILTEEEKAFKKHVDESLGDRDDGYARAFRKDNTRLIGGRSLILLEKIKEEIKNDEMLTAHGITPIQLISVFIEKTESYVDACANVEMLTAKHDEIYEEYKATFEEGSRKTRKLARDIEVINKKIDTNREVADFCMATIEAAVMPVLNMVVGR